MSKKAPLPSDFRKILTGMSHNHDMQQKPYEDILGGYYMEFALSYRGQQWNGEFHTPKPVCDLVAQITMGDIWNEKPEGTIQCCEPACGAGAMILACAAATPPEHRRRLRFTAIDISRTACDMCFINTTLWGIPCRVYWGNTLSMEMWAAWSNIHWFCPWLTTLYPYRQDLPAEIVQGQPPEDEEVKALAVALGQRELALV